MRTALGLYVLAFAVRAIVFAAFPDPAYPDSSYYVDVARSIAAGHGLTVDFVWIFAEVGNRIPDPAVLPIASNAHWLPLPSFIQAPFISILGPTPLASALPGIILGSFAAPLTWLIARDAGARSLVAVAAGVLVAIPGAALVFMAQPEAFGLSMLLVPLTLLALAKGLRGNPWAFALSGLGAGLMAIARNDGILLGGTVALVWVLDRLRSWRLRRGRRSWSHVDDRAPVPLIAALIALGLFLLVVAPWWWRQIATFGSISPTTSNGAALWLRDLGEWDSITAQPSLQTFLAQGPAAIVASRLAGLGGALANFAVVLCSVVLVPFFIVGLVARWRSPSFRPWLVYAVVLLLGATFLYPVHVPGGAFIHSAIGLLPGVAILSIEGLLLVLGWFSGRWRAWDERGGGTVVVWVTVAIVVAIGVAAGRPTIQRWGDLASQRQAVARALDTLGAPASDRLFTVDAAGFRYWTGRPGVVTTNDPLPVVEAIGRAYGVRWLVLEREGVPPALGPVLAGQRPPWVGAPALTIPSGDGGLPRLVLYPVCFDAGDPRCSGG
ncbi:MAG TPA: hypothetical protein VNH13_06320 [Candidatus Acidoferrales bacterium]|nr:hypothetical protein [Candidatus Acidoferrales bacterium]